MRGGGDRDDKTTDKEKDQGEDKAMDNTGGTPPPPLAIECSDEHQATSISLQPYSETIVTVQVCVLPGAGYRHWKGVLPFHAQLRIYEGLLPYVITYPYPYPYP